MAKAATAMAARQPVNQGQRFANDAVSIEACAPASRLNLRANATGKKAMEKTLGLTLPANPGETTAKAGKHALWLGPDEWLVIDEKNANTSMVPDRANANVSAVDISHRNTAFNVSGSGAANTLNAACPRDLSLSAFPKGTASRTILEKAEVVLYRTSHDTFRVECWRSFAPYVWGLLLAGAKDAHI